jgi:hypothetical protein
VSQLVGYHVIESAVAAAAVISDQSHHRKLHAPADYSPSLDRGHVRPRIGQPGETGMMGYGVSSVARGLRPKVDQRVVLAQGDPEPVRSVAPELGPGIVDGESEVRFDLRVLEKGFGAGRVYWEMVCWAGAAPPRLPRIRIRASCRMGNLRVELPRVIGSARLG